MRICHLTTVHDWNDVRIFVKMCRSAVSEGFHVDLVAPVASASAITETDGVKVHPLRKYRSRLLRASLGTIRAIRAAVRIRAVCYHVHDPELLPLVLTLRLLQRRVLFDFHEEFAADVSRKPYIDRRLRNLSSRLARWCEFLLCASASAIVTATPRIRDRLPISTKRATVIHNFPSLDEFPAATPAPFHRRSPAAYYIGGVTEIRGCFKIVQAARLLASGDHRIEVRIAGPFANMSFERQMRAAAVDLKVDILGRRTREEVISDLGDARVGLVLFQPHPNHCHALPNKLFEYMAAGIAVVASNFPLWTEIIERAGCGVVVDPKDRQSIANAIRELVRDPARAEQMGRRGRRAVEALYHWHSQWKILLRLYRVGPEARR